MSYTHTGARAVELRNDPVDADGTDWVYFAYDNWLRADETITAHEAAITGGTVVTGSTYLGSMTDEDGNTYSETYGVQFSVAEGASSVTVTHRVTTETSGAIDLGRVDIDHSVLMRVRAL